jgi:hypothetical protein
MALLTSSYESYCHKVSSRGIYTRWFYVHSLHPGQAHIKVHQCANQANQEALWTGTWGCVQSLLYTDLGRQSISYTIHWRCGEMAELEGREPHVNYPPHLSWHPKGICETARFWLEQRRQWVGRYDNTQQWGSTQLHGSTRSLGKSESDKMIEMIECVIHCIMRWNDMRYNIQCKLSTPESPEYLLSIVRTVSATPVSPYAPIAQSVSIIPVSPYTRYSSVLCDADWWWWWETDYPTQLLPGPLCEVHLSSSI